MDARCWTLAAWACAVFDGLCAEERRPAVGNLVAVCGWFGWLCTDLFGWWLVGCAQVYLVGGFVRLCTGLVGLGFGWFTIWLVLVSYFVLH